MGPNDRYGGKFALLDFLVDVPLLAIQFIIHIRDPSAVYYYGSIFKSIRDQPDPRR